MPEAQHAAHDKPPRHACPRPFVCGSPASAPLLLTLLLRIALAHADGEKREAARNVDQRFWCRRQVAVTQHLQQEAGTASIASISTQLAAHDWNIQITALPLTWTPVGRQAIITPHKQKKTHQLPQAAGAAGIRQRYVQVAPGRICGKVGKW